MKKVILLVLISTFIISCGTPGRVCGGSGGRRCVEVTKKPSVQTFSETKRNS